METRTVHDPFHGKDVQISDRLVDRLRGKYACGPMMANGEPEFGWRETPKIPIQIDAANRIDELEEALRNAYCFINENTHFASASPDSGPEPADSFSYEAAPLLGSIQLALGQSHAEITAPATSE